MAIVLGANQYGKAEVRVVAFDRSAPRHTLVDLNVSSTLRGDFAAAHTAGDNAHVLTTDWTRSPARRRSSIAYWASNSSSPRPRP